jgi:hypothetical protein
MHQCSNRHRQTLRLGVKAAVLEAAEAFVDGDHT